MVITVNVRLIVSFFMYFVVFFQLRVKTMSVQFTKFSLYMWKCESCEFLNWPTYFYIYGKVFMPILIDRRIDEPLFLYKKKML